MNNSNKISGKKISNHIYDNIKSIITSITGKDIIYPKIGILLNNDTYASSLYVKKKQEKANELGIDCEIIIPKNNNEDYIIDLIKDCQREKDGFMIQIPMNSRSMEHSSISSIEPSKDIDGLTHYNIGSLSCYGFERTHFISCTALACMACIRDVIDIQNLKGMKVTIIGFTSIVGIPLAHMLIQLGATVSIFTINSKKKDLNQSCLNADLLISCTGAHGIINKNNINKDAIFIDVGISSVNGKLVGDCEIGDGKLFKYYTPTPGGVGVCCIAALMTNAFISSNDVSSYEVYKKLFL